MAYQPVSKKRGRPRKYTTGEEKALAEVERRRAQRRYLASTRRAQEHDQFYALPTLSSTLLHPLPPPAPLSWQREFPADLTARARNTPPPEDALSTGSTDASGFHEQPPLYLPPPESSSSTPSLSPPRRPLRIEEGEDLHRRLGRLGLYLNRPERAVICIACKYALKPSGVRVSKHLGEKHRISTRARVGLCPLIQSL